MHPATFVSLLLSLLALTTTSTASCTADDRREGLRLLIQAFINGTDENIAKVPLADNVTSIIQIQGARFVLGRDLAGAQRAIRIVNAIVTNFGPDPNSLSSYFDNGVNMAYINGTADVGLTVEHLEVPLIERAPATQNMLYDLNSCKAYEAVGTVEPVNGVIQRVLEALLLQNLGVDSLLDLLPVDELLEGLGTNWRSFEGIPMVDAEAAAGAIRNDLEQRGTTGDFVSIECLARRLCSPPSLDEDETLPYYKNPDRSRAEAKWIETTLESGRTYRTIVNVAAWHWSST